MARRAVEVREFDSKSSDSTYRAVRYNDGTFSCDCKGWTIKKKGMKRYCDHTGKMGDTKGPDEGMLGITEAEMVRRSLRGERFDIVRRYVDAQTGQRRVVVTPIGQEWKPKPGDKIRILPPLSPRDRDSAREQFVVTREEPVKPPKPGVPPSRVQVPEPTRAKIVFDEEV